MRTTIKLIDPLVEFQTYIPAAAAYRLIMVDIVAHIIKIYGIDELLKYSNIDNIGRLFNTFDPLYFDRERATSFLKSDNHSSKGIKILKRLYQLLDENESILALKTLYQKAGNLAYADDILFIIENKIRSNRKIYLAEINRYSSNSQETQTRYHTDLRIAQVNVINA
jgi:hypothetical protein